MRVQDRRTDVFPVTWEIPVGIALTWLLGSVLVLPAGQGLAFALLGDGFVWPGPRLADSLRGLIVGDPGRGLSPEIEATVPPAALVYALALVVALLLAAISIFALSRWWLTVGPMAQLGMATRHEAAAVLGRHLLKRRSRTIRPDLCHEARP